MGRSLLSAHQHTPTASEASSSEKEKNNNSKDDSKENNGETVSVTHVTPKQYEEQQSEQIKISVELLSSAIKALESHIEGSSSNSNRKTGHNDVGVNQVEAEVEVNSTAATNTLIIAPTLGRALGQLGLLYLHPFR